MLRLLFGYGPILPRLIHAIIVGGSAVVVYLLTKNEYVTGAVVVAVNVFGGELVAHKIKPVARRTRPLSPYTVEQIEKLQIAINGDIHDMVNLLAALRAQMAFTKDSMREVVDELQSIEDTNLGKRREK